MTNETHAAASAGPPGRGSCAAATTDLLHDPLRSLDAIFRPRSVAVIGATERPRSVGRTILSNLIATPFGGAVYPVNPERRSVLGVRAYRSIADVPEPVDLAVVVTPAATVPDVAAQCVAAGTRGIVVISAGFKELGAAGEELERRVREQLRGTGVRLIGPNCLGVMNPVAGLNATFAAGMATPGRVALVSQSGALLTAILDWSLRERVGFSAVVSAGSMLDVSWGDLIDYFGDDPHTRAILLYMESIGDARTFLSAARAVALAKPIIVIKPGRSEQAARAAVSHTGAITGADDVIDAAFRRTGVLRVDTIAELFSMAEVLATQPRPRGPRLTIVTNAGGPAVLATDALIAAGGELAPLAPAARDKLDGVLPHAWSHANPIDVLGDAGADRYAAAVELAAADPDSDGLLVILSPQDMTEPTQTAEGLARTAKALGPIAKPLLASWMGGATVAAGEDVLRRAGIPTFPYPDTAARMFTYLWRSAYNLAALYETPALPPDADADAAPDRDAVASILETARGRGRTLLTEHESKQILAAYQIPTTPTTLATTAREAADAADAFGYPVVLKLHSTTITHKSDVGGVLLDLRDRPAVEQAFAAIRASVAAAAAGIAFEGVCVQPMLKRPDAYELILGSTVDPQFGPVLLFGSGGQLVEVFKDRSVGLPPLNATLARRMMEQTKVYRALRGVRGRRAIDLPALAQLLVRFAQLVVEQPRVKEIEINPLLASPDGLVALDARVVLHDPATPGDRLPRPAIRPYPSQYVRAWTTRDGMPVTIRPIRPEDEPLLVAFHATLGDRTVRYRYFSQVQLDVRTAHDRLARTCFNDYDRELALVADHRDPRRGGGRGGRHEILGVARLSKIPGGGGAAEFAVVVSDAAQNRGVGTQLLSGLLNVARAERVSLLRGDILPENLPMQRLCEKLGFVLGRPDASETVRATLRLQE